MLCDRIRRPCDRHVPCILETCGNIVPHGRKWQKLLVYKVGRGNAFVLMPQYSHQGPLTRGPFTRQPSCHVAPLTAVRVDPCGLLPRVRALCATCASRGLAQPCHVALHAASHPRRLRVPRHPVSRATSAPRSC